MAGKDIFAALLYNIGIFKRPDDKLLNRHVICLDTARSEGLLFAQLRDHSEHEQTQIKILNMQADYFLSLSVSNIFLNFLE